MNKIFLGLMIVVVLACSTTIGKKKEGAKLFDNNTALKTFPAAGGWGYSIDVNGSKFIRQETIPVLPGSHPFATEQQAQRVGAWVETRIRHNEAFSLTLPVLQSLTGVDSTGN